MTDYLVVTEIINSGGVPQGAYPKCP
jgi:hypothetical protein